MLHHGYFRVAAASPRLKVGDCRFNTDETILLLQRCERQNVHLIVFPEMGLTGYTCHDLFHHPTLINAASEDLDRICQASLTDFRGLIIVGLPILQDSRLFNCAAIIQQGKLLGVVPKSYLPTYKEFYDNRYFAPAAAAVSSTIALFGNTVPFGTDLLFTAKDYPTVTVGVEICEDLWTPIPPSCLQALAGATILANLSASNETIGKANYRRQLVQNQSGRCLAAYLYAAAGPGESTTDVVFGGHCVIAENSTILAESQRFKTESQLIVSDIDTDRLQVERMTINSYHGGYNDSHRSYPFRRIPFHLLDREIPTRLLRPIDPHPFVPAQSGSLNERCEEIFQIQIRGLAQRLKHIGTPTVSIGVSGGLDSTLALLVVAKTMAELQESPTKILGLTLPGFGTTIKTLGNAHSLMSGLGIRSQEVDIRPLCFDQMVGLRHSPFGIPLVGLNVHTLTQKMQELPLERLKDLVFENIQARVRTSLLMSAGFVIGTGDLSELALGWCTYNADHMSMYNPNVSIPKTLVKFLVRWIADHEFTGSIRETLHSIVDTEISPELLPTRADGSMSQSTEGTIGPYELHDFFLYHFMRYACQPAKILYLAQQAQFDRTYSSDEIRQWLKVFISRFFQNQYKRSCLPDGPKVGSVSLSPRGDWRMPSDAVARHWLEELDLRTLN